MPQSPSDHFDVLGPRDQTSVACRALCCLLRSLSSRGIAVCSCLAYPSAEREFEFEFLADRQRLKSSKAQGVLLLTASLLTPPFPISLHLVEPGRKKSGGMRWSVGCEAVRTRDVGKEETPDHFWESRGPLVSYPMLGSCPCFWVRSQDKRECQIAGGPTEFAKLFPRFQSCSIFPVS